VRWGFALTLAVASSACGDTNVACEQRADVVACVDDVAVTRAEAEAHLHFRPPLPGQAALPDARKIAVDEAVRVRLFAGEARARGLRAPEAATPAQQTAALNQALIRDELARQRIGAEHISDDEARRFYEANPGRINTVDAVHCYALYTDSAERAEQLYRELSGAGRDAFVAAGGADVGTIRRLDRSANLDMLRLASTLRAPRAIAGPVRTADNRYLLLYADALEMNVAPFEGTVVAQTKNLISRERERAALDALFQRLRAAKRVAIVQSAVAMLPVPQPPVLDSK
jgi:hypothetical protein